MNISSWNGLPTAVYEHEEWIPIHFYMYSGEAM